MFQIHSKNEQGLFQATEFGDSLLQSDCINRQLEKHTLSNCR